MYVIHGRLEITLPWYLSIMTFVRNAINWYTGICVFSDFIFSKIYMSLMFRYRLFRFSNFIHCHSNEIPAIYLYWRIPLVGMNQNTSRFTFTHSIVNLYEMQCFLKLYMIWRVSYFLIMVVVDWALVCGKEIFRRFNTVLVRNVAVSKRLIIPILAEIIR